MIKFENITKSYKTKTVLKNINLDIESNKLVVIIGESGCGKTTMLKMINKLIKPTSGKISINDKDIRDINDVILRRNIGYVIQQTGLFPHMTARENIELIPRILKLPKEKVTEDTIKIMEMIGLEPNEFLDRFPHELSGGQQQRIGVARAFACDPDIILMDEPFSALDPISRSDLQDELISIHSKLQKTIVFVTHDMDEAVKIADMICIMKDGEVLQYDTPENILKNPINSYVETFVGKNRIWSSPEFIKIKDIMIDKPIVAHSDFTVLNCIDRMRQKNVDSLMIVEKKNNNLLGIVKASHIRSIANKNDFVSNYMKTEFPTLNPDNTILDALKLVTGTHMSTVPVVDDKNRLNGLITRTSIVTTMSQQFFDYKEED